MNEPMPLKILLAEDNLVNQKIAVRILERLGYAVDVVKNGLEVLASLQKQHYDVVFMDIQMPEMDGITATQQIHLQYLGKERPWIIAMTADGMPEDKKQYQDAGMDDYVSKPIKIDALVQALENPQLQAHLKKDGSSSSVDEQVLNPEVARSLQEFLGEDFSQAWLELITSYLEDAAKQLEQLHLAIREENATLLEKSAHILKSSSASMGAQRLSQLCQEAETIGRSGSTLSAVPLMDKLSREYERVRAALEQERKRWE